MNARQRQRRAAHRDEINAHQRRRYAADAKYRKKLLAAMRAAYARRRRKAAENPDYGAKLTATLRSKSRRQNLKATYGLSLEEFDALLRQQGGACAICRKRSAKTLCVDHCHATGKIRGLLCRKCNFGLGLYGDDPDVLEAAAAYVRRNSNGSRKGSDRGPSRTARKKPNADRHGINVVPPAPS